MKKTFFQRQESMVFTIFLLANLLAHLPVFLSENALLLNWYQTDDAFYYFKTAQNIAEGRGITYDGLAPTNGFHPLWMLVCVPVFALAYFDLYLPLRLLVLVQVVMNAASGYLLYRLFSHHSSQAAGWLAAAAWMFLPIIHDVTTKLGLETGINALTLIFLLYRVALFSESDQVSSSGWNRELVLVGCAAVLALMSRLDNIFILIMLGLWLVFRQSDMRWHTQLDWLLIFLSAIGGYFLRMQNSENLFHYLPFTYLLLIFSMTLKPICLYIFGQYRSDEDISLRDVLIRTALAVSLSSLLIAVIFYLLHDVLGILTAYPRLVPVYDWALSSVLLLTTRGLRKLRDQRFGHSNQGLRFSADWRCWFGRAAAYFLPLFSALAIYMIINLIYAGSAMPVSGQIKRWWGTLPNTVYGQPYRTLEDALASLLSSNKDEGPFWLLTRPLYQAASWLSDLFSLPTAKSGEPHMLILVLVWGMAIALILAVLEVHGRRFTQLVDRFALCPIMGGGLVHALSYKTTGYLHVRYWYWITQMLLVMVGLALLAAVLLERWEKNKKMRSFLAGSTKIAALLFWLVISYVLLNEFPIKGNVASIYDIDGDRQFLETYTRPGDVIGITGGGLIGYFMPDRTILNLDGLINSAEYFKLLKENRLAEYHRQVGTDYILGEEQMLLESDPYRWTYTDRLLLVAKTDYYQLYQYCPDGCH